MLHGYFENEVDLEPVRLNAVFGEFYIHHAIENELNYENGKMIPIYNQESYFT